jgi:heme a synthase
MKHCILRSFALVTSIFSYFMLLMGAIVTKTGSGKGCGNSWPFCHGKLIPQSLPMETVIEYSHRIISGGVGLLVFILTIWSWIVYRNIPRVKILGFMSLFFILLQGALGALTVIFVGTFAKKAALALHFGFSLISFASVVLLTIYLFQIPNLKELDGRTFPRDLRYMIWWLAIYTYFVVYTGAFVRHTQATMACGYHFPFCGNVYFPHLSSLAGIHMLHRFAALGLWLLVLWFLIFVIRYYKKHLDIVRVSWVSFILITLQFLSGVVTIFSGGQLMVALFHTTMISIFFVTICYLCMQVGLPWRVMESKE